MTQKELFKNCIQQMFKTPITSGLYAELLIEADQLLGKAQNEAAHGGEADGSISEAEWYLFQDVLEAHKNLFSISTMTVSEHAYIRKSIRSTTIF